MCIRECHGWDGGLTDARLLGANGSSEMDINFVDAEDEGRRHNGTDGRREEGRSRREEEDGAADRSFTMQDAAPTPHPFYFEFSAAERDGQQIVQSRGVDGQDKERRIGEEHAHHGGDAHHRRGQQDYDHDMTISSDVTGTVVSPDDDWTRRGHQPMICSRCCIERGPEGDVVCLGCVAAAGGVV